MLLRWILVIVLASCPAAAQADRSTPPTQSPAPAMQHPQLDSTNPVADWNPMVVARRDEARKSILGASLASALLALGLLVVAAHGSMKNHRPMGLAAGLLLISLTASVALHAWIGWYHANVANEHAQANFSRAFEAWPSQAHWIIIMQGATLIGGLLATAATLAPRPKAPSQS